MCNHRLIVCGYCRVFSGTTRVRSGERIVPRLARRRKFDPAQAPGLRR